MFSTLHQLSGTKLNIKRGHRLVILPDFQGLGIGVEIMNFIGDYYKSLGYSLNARMTHFALIKALHRDPNWKFNGQKNYPNVVVPTQNMSDIYGHTRDKACATFCYMGPKINLPKLFIVVDNNNQSDEYIQKVEETIQKYNDTHYVYLTCGQIGAYKMQPHIQKLLGKYKIEHNFYKNKNGTIISKVAKNNVVVNG